MVEEILEVTELRPAEVEGWETYEIQIVFPKAESIALEMGKSMLCCISVSFLTHDPSAIIAP